MLKADKRRAALRSSIRMAVTTCALAATALAAATPDSGRVLLQVLPAQDFTPGDGRPMDVPAWRIDARIAQRVVDAFAARGQPLVIDYEHQTLHAESNGQPAPAAGWIHGLRWVDGEGLFAEAELTERARQLIAGGEYRYFSPVMAYDGTSGRVQQILMGALTNNPAIHGMRAVDLVAAATARFDDRPETQTEITVDLLAKLLAALGLPADATEDQALARAADLMAESQAAHEALELTAEADAAALTAAVTALKAKAVTATRAAIPDPAHYVPVAVVQELQASVAALTASQQAREAEDLIAPALADGRLLPAEEPWARSLVTSAGGVAALSELLKVRQPIAALAGTQTGGKPPRTDEAHGLNETELAVAAACGLTPEAYAAARA